MQTIICKKTKKKYYGNVLGSIKCHSSSVNSIATSWTFQTWIKNKHTIWECNGDYWDLVNDDLRKVKKALRMEEKDLNSEDALIKIMKWGHCR